MIRKLNKAVCFAVMALALMLGFAFGHGSRAYAREAAEQVTLKLVPSSREEAIITKSASGETVDPIVIKADKGTTITNAIKSYNSGWSVHTCPWATGSGTSTGTLIDGYMTHGQVINGNLSTPFTEITNNSEFITNRADGNAILNEDTTIYVPLDIGITHLVIESPSCTKSTSDGDPVVTMASGAKGYRLDGAWWCKSAGEQSSWTGSFAKMEACYAGVWLVQDYGYRLIYDQHKYVSVDNGECTKVYQVFPSQASGIIVQTEVAHNWDIKIKKATMTSTGVKTYICKDCGLTKEETIPKLTLASPTLTTNVNLNKKTVKATWNAVKGADGYVFSWRVKGGKWTSKNTTALNATVKGIQRGKKYVFKVVATKKATETTEAGTSEEAVNYREMKTIGEIFILQGKKSAKVKWLKVSTAKGYTVEYARKKSFKNAKSVTVKGKKKLSRKIKKLKSGKNYYFRVAHYSTAGGHKYIGVPSAVKKAKVR